MVALAAAVMLLAAVASMYAGWALTAHAASQPYSAYVLTIYWGPPALSLLLFITAFGLAARKPWARYPALAACFVAPALLVIVLAVMAAGGWLFLLVVLLGWGEQRGLLASDPGTAYSMGAIVLIGMPLALYFSWRLYRHLKSDAVRLEFAGSQSADGRTGARAAGFLIAAFMLLCALAMGEPLRIRVESLPASLRTEAMSTQLDAAAARSDALLAAGALFSEDERTIILRAFDDPKRVFVLDAESGRLSKKAITDLPAFPAWRSFSSDGQKVVSRQGELVSLATDAKRKLASIPPYADHLGFAGADRLLASTGGHPFDKSSIRLFLVDVAADRVVYSKELRGDYSEGKPRPRYGTWSPDRRLYAWHDNETRKLHILRVADGELERFDCHCDASLTLTFSREGDLIYIAGQGMRTAGKPYPKGVVFDFADKSFTPGLPYGPILFASTQEDRVVQWTLGEQQYLTEYPARRFDVPRWRVPLQNQQPAMTPDGRKLILIGGEAPWELHIAEASERPDTNPPEFRPLKSMIQRKVAAAVSPQSGSVLFLGSPMVEILRLETTGRPVSGSFAVDLRDGRRIGTVPR